MTTHKHTKNWQNVPSSFKKCEVHLTLGLCHLGPFFFNQVAKTTQKEQKTTVAKTQKPAVKCFQFFSHFHSI